MSVGACGDNVARMTVRDPVFPRDSPGTRRAVAMAVAALCVLSLLVKLWVNAARTGLGHGDVSFYYGVARNLAEGRGFVIDYVWNFWNRPEGIPTPSNVWWMPLPSVLCAIGMKPFGSTFVVAQNVMIVVTSFVPWATYMLGRELVGGRRVPLVAAALSATFHLFLDQPCAPLSHGPFLLTSTWVLWAILRSVRDPRWLPGVGVLIAITHLSRSDAVVGFATLVAAHVIARRRSAARAWLLVPVAYVLVMSPWWAHNLSVHGAIQPGGSFRAVFMTNYEQWYSLPESVTMDAWLEKGTDTLLDQKLRMSQRNLAAAATGLVTGTTDREPVFQRPPLTAVLVLSWLGLVAALLRQRTRRTFGVVLVHLALVFCFYSLLFTAVGSASFRTGMYAVHTALLVAAALGLDRIAAGAVAVTRRLRQPDARAHAVATGLLVIALAWIGWGHATYAREFLQRKGAGIQRMGALYDVMNAPAFRHVLGPDPVVMARDVHQLAVLTGLRCVAIPFEPEPVIRDVARRYGVTHLLHLGDPSTEPVREGLRTIERNPAWKRVIGPVPVHGVRLLVYELVDR